MPRLALLLFVPIALSAVTIPAGATVTVRTEDKIDLNKAQPGDLIWLRVVEKKGSPVPDGTRLRAVIATVAPPTLRVETVVLKDRRYADVRAHGVFATFRPRDVNNEFINPDLAFWAFPTLGLSRAGFEFNDTKFAAIMMSGSAASIAAGVHWRRKEVPFHTKTEIVFDQAVTIP